MREGGGTEGGEHMKGCCRIYVVGMDGWRKEAYFQGWCILRATEELGRRERVEMQETDPPCKRYQNMKPGPPTVSEV